QESPRDDEHVPRQNKGKRSGTCARTGQDCAGAWVQMRGPEMTAVPAAPRFGVFLPSYVLPGEPAPSAAFLADYARRAEDVGFDSVWVFDHLFDAPPSYRVVFMEPLTTLATVVSATRRVTLGTGILILPLRDPVLTAKEVANLDATSGGRVVLGVGVGWDEKEFRALRIPKETRGRRMDEMLEIIKGLWTRETF